MRERGLAVVLVLVLVGSVLAPAVGAFTAPDATVEGGVELVGDPALNGTSYSYELQDLESTSDPVVNLTGFTNTEWENVTASSIRPGWNQSVSYGGSLPLTGPSANDNPELKVTAAEESANEGPNPTTTQTVLYHGSGYSNDVGDSGEVEIHDPPDTIRYITVHADASSDDSGNLYPNLRLVTEQADGTYGEGTMVAEHIGMPAPGNSKRLNVSNFDTGGASVVTVEFVYDLENAGSEGESTLVLGAESAASSKMSHDGSLLEKAGNVTLSEWGDPTNVVVESDDGESADLGDFSDGETKTVEFNVTRDATEVNLSADGGSFDVSLAAKERTQTTDAGIVLNGHEETVDGPIADGETVSRTLPSEWLQEGTNELTVEVGDGSLSADAPTPQVGLAYAHNASVDVALNTSAGQWRSVYSTSRTFTSDRTDATLEVSTGSDVVKFTSVEVDAGSGYNPVSPSKWSFDGANDTLLVDLGDRNADETVSVRARAQKVDVEGGSLTVTDPTVPGAKLDTEFRVDDVTGETLRIETGDQRLLELTDVAWQDPQPTSKFVADGTQTLRLPNAREDLTARVGRTPLEVSPESDEVLIDLVQVGDSPRFKVEPGATGADTVVYTWHDAISGTDYSLWSSEYSTARDEGTADGSTIALTDHNDNPETLQIVPADGGGPEGPIDSGGLPQTVVLIAAAASLVATAFLQRQFGLVSSGKGYLLLGGVAVVVTLLGLSAIAPGAVQTLLGTSPVTILGAGTLGLIGLFYGSRWVPGGRKTRVGVITGGAVLLGLLMLEMASGGAVSSELAATLASALDPGIRLASIVGAGLLAVGGWKWITGELSVPLLGRLTTDSTSSDSSRLRVIVDDGDDKKGGGK